MILNKSRKRISVLLAIAVFILAIFNPVYAGSIKSRQDNKHFLWSVETGRNTIYLLGSIHLLKKDSYPLPEAIEKIYQCCRNVMFETDMDAINTPAAQERMLKKGLYRKGQTLSKNISPRTMKMLKKRGLPVKKFEQYKPWFIALSIAAMEIQRLGFNPDRGVDRYFFNKAKKDYKNLHFLESADFQLNLMASLNRRQQESFLKETLKELEIIESMASDMINAWRNGDSEKLYSIIKEGFDEYPDIYNRFFVQRNKRWIGKIENLIKKGDDILIIVGAGHLAGRGSVVELLKKRGYSINQL